MNRSQHVFGSGLVFAVGLWVTWVSFVGQVDTPSYQLCSLSPKSGRCLRNFHPAFGCLPA